MNPYLKALELKYEAEIEIIQLNLRPKFTVPVKFCCIDSIEKFVYLL